MHSLRCDSLAEVNTMLREQLSSANEQSDSYAEDLQKAKDELHETQNELKDKESQWREDQEVICFNNNGRMKCFFSLLYYVSLISILH